MATVVQNRLARLGSVPGPGKQVAGLVVRGCVQPNKRPEPASRDPRQERSMRAGCDAHPFLFPRISASGEVPRTAVSNVATAIHP